MAIADVVEQLKDHCLCLADQEEKDVTAVANEMINLISLSSCWTQESCETLLKSMRTENIHIDCIDSACGNDAYFRFRPFYQFGIENDTISIVVARQNGLSTTYEELEPEEYALTHVKGYYEIIIDLKRFARRCHCTCDNEELYLEISYEAGYDQLPDCLFPEVCEIITIITASKLGCGSLEECCAMKEPDVTYKLKSKKVGELSWSWGQDTNSIEYLYQQLVNANKFKALSMISLCGSSELDYQDRLWVYGSDIGVW